MPFPLIVVDNGGVQGGSTTLGNMSDVANISITGGALLTNAAFFNAQSLLIGSNSTILLGSSGPVTFQIQSNATIQASGRMTIDGTSVSGNWIGTNAC